MKKPKSNWYSSMVIASRFANRKNPKTLRKATSLANGNFLTPRPKAPRNLPSTSPWPATARFPAPSAAIAATLILSAATLAPINSLSPSISPSKVHPPTSSSPALLTARPSKAPSACKASTSNSPAPDLDANPSSLAMPRPCKERRNEQINFLSLFRDACRLLLNPCSRTRRECSRIRCPLRALDSERHHPHRFPRHHRTWLHPY